MKQEYDLKSAKFISSKDEYGFQEVLDEFPKAKEIIVITFDISPNQTRLVDAIKHAQDNCNITIVTNIPNRWESYYSSQAVSRARKNISIYMNKLDPLKFLGPASVYFNFSNHGKIIMTDTIAYVGSENFSEESKKNTEFGIIVRGQGFIDFFKDSVLPEICENSVPYLDYDYTSLLVEAKMILASIVKIRTEIFDCMYEYSDDWSNKGLYFNDTEARLSVGILESLRGALDDAENISFEIENALEEITDDNDDVLSDAEEFIEKISKNVEEIARLTSDDSVYGLAEFDPEENTNRIISEEYSAEAYDEDLDKYIKIASAESNERITEMAQDAKESIDAIISKTEQVEKLLDGYIDSFSKYELRKVNTSIDNT